MTKFDSVLQKLSELYDFNRRLKAYKIKVKAEQVGGGSSPPAPTPPGARVRSGRFPEHVEP